MGGRLAGRRVAAAGNRRVTSSRLYFGSVLHNRLRPRPHRFRYKLFWTLFDLDEVADLSDRYWLFSHNRFNLVSLQDRDHGDGSGRALRPQIERLLVDNGISFEGGTVCLFCMPRVLGYGFNPLSIYFCHRKDDSLAAIIYEVHNTFGERHSYVFDASEAGLRSAHGCGKRFFVSPFLDMAMRYEFRTRLPTERFAITIRGTNADGTLIHASISGAAAPFSTAMLLHGLLRYPLMTLKVTAAIHWQAFRLWLKGIGVRRKPAPPEQCSTPVSSLP